MIASADNKGLTIGAIVIVFTALVYAFFLLHARQSHVDTNPQVSGPAYQTGDAFELIGSGDKSGTAEPSTLDEKRKAADQAIASANGILRKYDLSNVTVPQEKQQEIDQQLTTLRARIEQLEKELITSDSKQ